MKRVYIGDKWNSWQPWRTSNLNREKIITKLAEKVMGWHWSDGEMLHEGKNFHEEPIGWIDQNGDGVFDDEDYYWDPTQDWGDAGMLVDEVNKQGKFHIIISYEEDKYRISIIDNKEEEMVWLSRGISNIPEDKEIVDKNHLSDESAPCAISLAVAVAYGIIGLVKEEGKRK